MNIDDLPQEVLEIIIHFLDIHSIIKFSKTCKIMNILCNKERIWKFLLENFFKIESKNDPKKEFIHCYLNSQKKWKPRKLETIQNQIQVKGVFENISVYVAGPSNSGKSCLIERLVKDSFSQRYKATIGYDFYSLKYNFQEMDFNFLFRFFDLGFDEKMWRTDKNIRNMLDICHGVFLCFSLNDKKSLQYLEEDMMRYLEKYNGIPILIGCKSDLEQDIDEKEIQIFIKKYHLPFIKVSSNSKENIKELLCLFTSNLVDYKKEKQSSSSIAVSEPSKYCQIM